ncbi:MAG: alpha/beta hydrolase [Chloroflexota bacterium]
MVQERLNIQRPLSLRFEANGINIHYLDWGEGSPRHVVLLHGLGGQGHSWDQFAQDVRQSLRVVAPDLRGHGESGHATDGYTLDKFAADVKSLGRHLNLPVFDLVGHSLGALVAIWFAAQQPALVNRLVLVDGGPGLNRELARQGSADRFARPLGFDTADEAKEWHRERYPTRSDGWLEQRVKFGMVQNWAGKWVFRHDPELYWVLDRSPQQLQEQEQKTWEMLAAIRCPVLLLRGEESTLLSPEAARRIASAAPNVTLLEIRGAGHSIPADAPEAFRDAVMKFLLEKF